MAEASSDPLAAALADRYRIERVLGSGGMATVYLARDLKHQRAVAIKVLKPRVAEILGSQRFLREIEITAGLHHPHIVAVHDSGEADGKPFYVMPWVEGESLRERLRREKQLPVDEAVALAREVASALSYAHARGIVHRDIKPENILLVDGHALVADFGIARAVVQAGGDRLTETGLMLGTPVYMSPEQAAGEAELDERTDIYALACVLHEVLAGEPPFTGATAQVVMARHLADEVPRVRRTREQVPPHVEAAIVRALAKLKADRFRNARQFADALAGPQAETTPRLDAGPGSRRTAAERRGNRAILVVAALAVLLPVALNVGGLRDWLASRAGNTALAEADSRRSVAVVPFENVGGNPDEEYFSDGLADELIAALSQLRSLRVAARTSAFAFKGQTRDAREIGRALNVATVLVGSVRKAANRVRVTAQLIDTESGLGLWSQAYDERDLADIFDIQADLALRIAHELAVNLTPSERGHLARKPTENLEAYTLYLKGRFAWSQRGENLFTAIDYFRQAIAADSQYAQAWAGLASVYAPLGVTGYIAPAEGRERMREAARRAVALDSTSAEAHTVLGAYLYVYEWDFGGAERAYRRSLEVDRDYPTAYLWLSFLLEGLGRFEEAIEVKRRLAELDPLSPTMGVASIHLRMGRYDLAKVGLREVIQLHSTYWQAHEGLGVACEATGELDEAILSFQRAVDLAGRTSRPRAGLARVLALAGRASEARQIVEQLRAEAATSDNYHPVVATALLAAGDMQGAIEWLETSYRQRHPDLVELNVDVRFAALRGDGRFRDLLRRIGFAP